MLALDNLCKASVRDKFQLVEKDKVEHVLRKRRLDFQKVTVSPMGINRHKFGCGLANQRCIHLAESLEVRINACQQKLPVLNVLGQYRREIESPDNQLRRRVRKPAEWSRGAAQFVTDGTRHLRGK